MKKTLFLALLAVPLLFCACGFDNLTVPKEVEVVTGATYEFYLAKLDSKKQEWLDFSKFLDIGKMITGDEDGASESSENQFELYKYNTGSEYQQLLMHMPLKDIDFDFGESFSNMNFAKSMQNFEMDKEISISNVANMSESKKLDMTPIKATLNAGVTFTGFTASELTCSFVGSSQFDTIKYKSGYLVVTTDSAVGGRVTLCDGDTEINYSEFAGKTASIVISDVTFKNSGMKLKFTGTSGVHFNAYIDSSSQIQEATGVNIDNPVVSPTEVTFPVTMSSDIESCTINTGSLTVNINNPSGWTTTGGSGQIIDNYTIDVSGGLTASVTKSSPTASLNNQTLQPQDIKAVANVTIDLHDASINFDNEPEVNVTVVVSAISATVKVGDSFETKIPKEEPISSDIKNYVSSITWDKAGFNVTVTNTLPSGNDIKLKFVSNFFGIEDVAANERTFAAGGATRTEKYEGASNKVTTFTEAAEADYVTKFDKMDITGEITLPHYDSTNKTISVVNVVPGETYHINISVVPNMNWTEADLQLKDVNNTNMKGQFDSNLNKSELFKTFGESLANDFASNINFTETPIFIYASVPDELDLFKNANLIKGTVKAYFGKQNGENVEKVANSPEAYVLGAAGAETITPKPMPKLEIKDGTVTTVFNTNDKNGDLKDALNLQAPAGVEGATLYLDYDVGLLGGAGGVTHVTKDQMDSLSKAGKSKITMDIVMIMTMKFDLTKDVNMNILEMMNKDSESGSGTKTDKEKDLFHRESATTAEDYQKYIDVVKSAELEFTKPKFPFLTTGGMSLKVDWGHNEKSECILKDGVNAVVAVNPSTLMKKYPLEPKIEIVIGQGTFGLPRTMEMEAGLKIRVKAEGPIQVYPFDGSKEAN